MTREVYSAAVQSAVVHLSYCIHFTHSLLPYIPYITCFSCLPRVTEGIFCIFAAYFFKALAEFASQHLLHLQCIYSIYNVSSMHDHEFQRQHQPLLVLVQSAWLANQIRKPA